MASELKAKEQQVQIVDLGKRLNVALAARGIPADRLAATGLARLDAAETNATYARNRRIELRLDRR